MPSTDLLIHSIQSTPHGFFPTVSHYTLIGTLIVLGLICLFCSYSLSIWFVNLTISNRDKWAVSPLKLFWYKFKNITIFWTVSLVFMLMLAFYGFAELYGVLFG